MQLRNQFLLKTQMKLTVKLTVTLLHPYATMQVFPLSEVAEAHKQVETEHTRGKVVLQVS